MRKVRSVLAGIDGIEEQDIDINYPSKTATVDLSNATVSPNQVMSAFNGTDFTLRLK